MKKWMILIAALAIAGLAQADIVDGDFSALPPGNVQATTSISVPADLANGWHSVGGAAQITASETVDMSQTSSATDPNRLAQIFTGADISGTLTLQFQYDFTFISGIEDFSDNTLQVELWGTDEDTRSFASRIELGTTAVGTAWTELLNVTYDIDAETSGFVTVSVGTFDADAYDFYGIRFIADGITDGGAQPTVETIELDNVALIPEPATAGMLGIGALISLIVRRVRT